MFLAQDGFVDQIVDSLEGVVTGIIDYVPNIFGAVVLLLIGWIISKFVVSAVRKLLNAIQFDRWIDRSGLGAYIERGGYSDSGHLLAKIVGWIIMLVFIQLAVDALDLAAVTGLVEGFIEWIPHVLIAIVLVIITGVVANFAKDTLSPTLSTQAAGGLMLKIINAAIWIFGGMLAFRELGFGAEIIDQLWASLTTGLTAILVIKFGVGGIWAARDRFWPKVYDAVES